MQCNIHNTELNFTTKTKGVPYHWIKKDVKGLDNICYGNEDDKSQTTQVADTMATPTSEAKPPTTVDKDKMSKEEWAAKNQKDKGIMVRMGAGKYFVSQGMSPHEAAKSGHLLEWVEYYLTGDVSDNIEAKKESDDDDDEVPFLDDIDQSFSKR